MDSIKTLVFLILVFCLGSNPAHGTMRKALSALSVTRTPRRVVLGNFLRQPVQSVSSAGSWGHRVRTVHSSFYSKRNLRPLVGGTLGGVGLSQSITPTSFASQCEDFDWDGTKRKNDQGYFEVHLSTLCNITLENLGDLTELETYFLNWISKEFEIHATIESETPQGLFEKRFKVTATTVENGDQVSIRQVLTLLSDKKSFLKLDSESKSIKGSGNTIYLKSNRYTYEVSQDSVDSKKFSLKASLVVQVEKPWYAPEGIFVSHVKEGVRVSFVQKIEKLIQPLGTELKKTLN